MSFPNNLIVLDIDGTLTLSYDYDRDVFGKAIGEILHCPPVDADLQGYVDKTSLGVSREAIFRETGQQAFDEEIASVKQRVMQLLVDLQRDDPGLFSPVPGADIFLKELRSLPHTGLAIATGCWQEEALLKLQASGLDVTGIPMATSDDDARRLQIMALAVERAAAQYGGGIFKHILYLGDGPWDLQASAELGFRFIGIGPRLQGLTDRSMQAWHPDYLNLPVVLASIHQALSD